MAERQKRHGARANEAATHLSREKTAAKVGHPISAARRAAFEVLLRVGEQRGHSDDLLHGPVMRGLTQEDRNLATALVLGVLRWQIALDARIKPLLQRPDTKLAVPVELALRLGAFQLLHMDRIPAHAALSESVELTRAAGHEHASGMVNAVLRKLATPQPSAAPKLFETTAAFSQRLGHPEWLAARWVANYGRAAAMAICEADQQEPERSSLFQVSEELPEMDAGSRLVAELAALAQPAAKRIWDCCAAPGGKTLVLAARHPDAEILATDVSPSRLKAMAERLQHARQVRTLQADATSLPASEGEFDLILCDVPCSGTGTLGRNPEIRHSLRPSDLARQAARQQQLLRAGLERLAPGGRLVYSTCSLEPEENEAVVAEVMRAAPGFSRVDVTSLSAKVEARLEVTPLIRDGVLRTLPGANFAGDGFYAAIIERR